MITAERGRIGRCYLRIAMTSPSRLAIIGVDGATYRVLDPMIEAGVMPALARFRGRGAHAMLTITLKKDLCGPCHEAAARGNSAAPVPRYAALCDFRPARRAENAGY